MRTEDLFSTALGLQKPWYVEKIEFKSNDSGRELHIHLNHERNSKFLVEEDFMRFMTIWKGCGVILTFSSMNAVYMLTFQELRPRRVRYYWWKFRGLSQVVPLHFSLRLMPHFGSKEVWPMRVAGVYLSIDSRRIWTIINRKVSEALSDQPLEAVKHLGVEETSTKKGHQYITVLTDMERKKVVGLAPGKDAEAFNNALINMEIRGADRNRVSVITMDMSPSFISAASKKNAQGKTRI
jgi:transposase